MVVNGSWIQKWSLSCNVFASAVGSPTIREYGQYRVHCCGAILPILYLCFRALDSIQETSGCQFGESFVRRRLACVCARNVVQKITG